VTEWWTYRLGSFLLFSARTYHRLIESYNADLWPWQLAMLAAAVIALAWWRRMPSLLADRVVFGGLAAAWVSVAWAFEHERFASINWAADYVAALYAAQAAVLLWAAVRGRAGFGRASSPRLWAGWALIALGLVVYPLLAPLLGRPWARVEVFAAMPEPTVIVTFGVLLLAGPMPRVLYLVPVASCLYAGAMLWGLREGEAWLALAAALLALGVVLADARRRRRRARRR
jgi:Family of unknown function (DUF6064)